MTVVAPGPVVAKASAAKAERDVAYEPRPSEQSWWQTRQGREALVERLLGVFTDPGVGRTRDKTRRRGLTKLLDWLQRQPGDTWQDRWLASGADNAGFDWADLPLRGRVPARRHHRDELCCGLTLLVAGQVIRPGYPWLLRQRQALMLAEARAAIDPDGFQRLQPHAEHAAGWARSDALNKLTWIVIRKGGLVRDITVGDCVELTTALQEHHFRGSAGRPLFYGMLKKAGVLPAAAPERLRVLRLDGRRSVEQIVDAYGIECRPVRVLLVEYLTERSPELDHTSLRSIARNLCRLFWRDLEIHHPGIDSLRLAPEVAQAWKQRLAHIRDADGRPVRPRVNYRSELVFVRAFYEDIARWSADDPARWALWVAPCPIKAAEVTLKKANSRVKSRMDQRTRTQLPLLPALLRAVERHRTDAEERVNTATATAAGRRFTAGGQELQRCRKGESGRVYAIDLTTTKRRDLSHEEISGVLVVGDGGSVAAHRDPHRGDAGADPPQLRRLHAADHRGGGADAAGGPVQDRRGEASAGLTRARGGADRDHLPGPGGQRHSAAGVGLRRVRADLEPADAVPVPTALRHRGPAFDPQLHPGMPRRHLTGLADHRRWPAAAVAPPRFPEDLRYRRHPLRAAPAYRGQGLWSLHCGHHDGLRRDLPRRRHRAPPGVHRPPPGRTAQRGVP